MTNDQIIELAKQAGFLIDEAPISQPYVIQATRYKIDDEIKRFAELVRNQTLEEAAKQCDEAMEGIWQFHPEYVNEVGRNCCTNLAKRIRGLQT